MRIRRKFTILIIILAVLFSGMCQEILPADSFFLQEKTQSSAFIGTIRNTNPQSEFRTDDFLGHQNTISQLRLAGSGRTFRESHRTDIGLCLSFKQNPYIRNAYRFSMMNHALCYNMQSIIVIIQYIHHQDGKKS